MNFSEVQKVVDEVRCAPFEFLVTRTTCPVSLLVPEPAAGQPGYVEHEFPELVFVQAWLWRDDSETQATGWGHGSMYFVDPAASRDDVVKRCFVAARDFAEHEVRESFEWQRARVLGPHMPLEELLALVRLHASEHSR